jgi:hypothetical protein
MKSFEKKRTRSEKFLHSIFLGFEILEPFHLENGNYCQVFGSFAIKWPFYETVILKYITDVLNHSCFGSNPV